MGKKRNERVAAAVRIPASYTRPLPPARPSHTHENQKTRKVKPADLLKLTVAAARERQDTTPVLAVWSFAGRQCELFSWGGLNVGVGDRAAQFTCRCWAALCLQSQQKSRRPRTRALHSAGVG